MQFKVFESGIENSGESLGAILDGFRDFPSVALKYLSKYGFVSSSARSLDEIDRTKWYPQQNWLSTFEAITNEVGTNSLYKVGRRMPENAILPPDINDVFSALAGIDIAYHMNHRKSGRVMFDPQTGMMLEGIGHFHFKPVAGSNQIVMHCETPYPCDFERGIVAGFASRFQPDAKTVHDAEAPCRKQGADSCTYVVWW
jgi:hypothetical protein